MGLARASLLILYLSDDGIVGLLGDDLVQEVVTPDGYKEEGCHTAPTPTAGYWRFRRLIGKLVLGGGAHR